MIDARMDFELEELLAKYRRIGGSMPRMALEYNNQMAFNTRSIGKGNLRGRTIQRSGTSKFIQGGRVLSVKTARFSRNIQAIEAQIGGRVVPQARDPQFMARLEFGGTIPSGRFGQTGLPSLNARSGSISRNISSGLSVPRLVNNAVGSRNVKGSLKKKRAVAIAVAVRERKQTVKMTDRRGRQSIYRVKGKGRGKGRQASEIKKIWTLSGRQHSTPGTHWLSDAVTRANAGRGKVFTRLADKHIARRALKSK